MATFILPREYSALDFHLLAAKTQQTLIHFAVGRGQRFFRQRIARIAKIPPTWRSTEMNVGVASALRDWCSISADSSVRCLWGERLMKTILPPVDWKLAVVLVCPLLATVCLAQDVAGNPSVIFENISTTGGLDPAGASPASQVDDAFPFEAGAADDFVLPVSPLCRWSVTRVQWTGKYWGESIPGTITGFRIYFWNDGGGSPASGIFSTPNPQTAIAAFEIAGSAAEMPSASGAPGSFDYDAALPQPLELVPGVRYWIQIQAVAEFPPQWGLHITQTRQGLAPVQYFDLLSMPAWTAVPDDGDLAFRVLGTALAANCDDGNACTLDSCVAGSCQSAPVVCDDGSACTVDSCDPTLGCQAVSITCDDQNACTVDSCNPSEGCVFTALDCTDGDACTTDVCNGGVCEHLGPPDFDGDGDVDLTDFDKLVDCVDSLQRSLPEACGCTDLNGDGIADMRDLAAFQSSYTGSK